MLDAAAADAAATGDRPAEVGGEANFLRRRPMPGVKPGRPRSVLAPAGRVADPDDALDLSAVNPLVTRPPGGGVSDIATVKTDLGDVSARRQRGERRLQQSDERVVAASAAQLAARDLSKLGLDVKVRTLEFGTWFGRVQRGEFDMSIGWSAEGSSPYALMRGLMDPKLVFPVGENGVQNWHRYGDEEAGQLLDVFAVTVDPDKRLSLVHKLEERFYETLPAIPLFPNPSWAVFNEERYTGFPKPDAPYAGGSPNALPEAALVLQSVKPVEPTQ